MVNRSDADLREDIAMALVQIGLKPAEAEATAVEIMQTTNAALLAAEMTLEGNLDMGDNQMSATHLCMQMLILRLHARVQDMGRKLMADPTRKVAAFGVTEHG